MLNIPLENLSFDGGVTFEVIKNNLIQYVTGAFLLGGIMAILLGFVSFFLLNIFRKSKV